MANTLIYQALWANKLAQRLDKPQNWKEVCDVVYTDSQTYNFPLVSTANEPAVATLTNTAAGRSTLSNVIPFVDTTETNQTITISIAEIDSAYVDFADQAQSNYAKIVSLGDLLGKKMNERDDIIRGIIREIQTANGFDLYMTNGGFVTWRPGDWEYLVAFMQANGYQFADEALRSGGRIGKETMGLFHYVSTSHAANHLMAGVRRTQKLGILASTFGKIYSADMPASSTAGSLSGTQIHTRIDYGLLVQTTLLPVIFDVNVADVA